eukprot:scaffold12670_cov119-Isochrysis_galbana.AAC.9
MPHERPYFRMQPYYRGHAPCTITTMHNAHRTPWAHLVRCCAANATAPAGCTRAQRHSHATPPTNQYVDFSAGALYTLVRWSSVRRWSARRPSGEPGRPSVNVVALWMETQTRG